MHFQVRSRQMFVLCLSGVLHRGVRPFVLVFVGIWFLQKLVSISIPTCSQLFSSFRPCHCCFSILSFFLSFFFTEVVCQPADLGCSMENYLVFFLPNPQAPFTKHGDHSRPTADENRAKVVLRLRLVRSGLWSLPLLGGKQPSPAAGHHAVRAAGRRRWRNPPSEPEQSLCPKRAPNNALNG